MIYFYNILQTHYKNIIFVLQDIYFVVFRPNLLYNKINSDILKCYTNEYKGRNKKWQQIQCKERLEIHFY